MKELLFSVTKDDFRIDTFRCGGKGGQKQNKTSSGVRLVHIESGAIGESREERSQPQNKRNAFNRLIETKEFKLWHKKKAAEMMLTKEQKREIERKVDNAMREENLLIELGDK
jgi:protein subunit release factor B